MGTGDLRATDWAKSSGQRQRDQAQVPLRLLLRRVGRVLRRATQRVAAYGPRPMRLGLVAALVRDHGLAGGVGQQRLAELLGQHPADLELALALALTRLLLAWVALRKLERRRASVVGCRHQRVALRGQGIL
jgi:hypothetical protein